jgi:hypothetical protein
LARSYAGIFPSNGRARVESGAGNGSPGPAGPPAPKRRLHAGALTVRRIGVAILALVLASVAAASWSFASDQRKPPAVGDMAPDVKLSDQNGKTFVLGDTLKEREFVVLAFYPKAFTNG